MELPILNADVIKRLLPHREPIIMVDALHDFDDKLSRAGLNILKENIFVKDKVFSETGLIEHMAQTAALHMGYHFFLEGLPPREGYITSIRNLHIHDLPKEGDILFTELEVLYADNNMSKVKLVTKLNGKALANSEMNVILKSH